MNRSRYLRAICAFMLGILLSGPALCDSASLTLVEIEDGDTVVALAGGERQRLQLAGIDAPEATPNPKLIRDAERTGLSHDALLSIGQLATAHLKTLARPGEKLVLQGDPGQPDRYGRIPAVVIGRDGRSLNVAMVEDGFAVTWRINNSPRSSAGNCGIWRKKRLPKAAVCGAFTRNWRRAGAGYLKTRIEI